MNILVIGGSYFAGRVFVLMAAKKEEFSLTLLNRGRYSLNLDRVREARCDRHDQEKLEELLNNTSWDAVVDFCAYEPGDVSGILNIPGFAAKHYLLFSTSSVCDVPGVSVKTESSEMISAPDGTRDGDYAYKKAVLEAELKRECEVHGTAFTIFRPSFIFGPYNYADREAWFIRQIAEGKKLPFPFEADARFQMVYVGDIACAVIRCLENRNSYNRIYYLAGPEVLDYPKFFDVLQKLNGRPLELDRVSNGDIVSERIPLPYPIIKDDLCDGSAITKELEFRYQLFEECMQKTWSAFMKVYGLNPK